MFSWASKSADEVHVDPLSEDVPNPEAFYQTLNMLVSGAEEMENHQHKDLNQGMYKIICGYIVSIIFTVIRAWVGLTEISM